MSTQKVGERTLPEFYTEAPIGAVVRALSGSHYIKGSKGDWISTYDHNTDAAIMANVGSGGDKIVYIPEGKH